MTKIENPFHYSEEKRPSIFATDTKFTGKWANKATSGVDLTPKASGFCVSIATRAESDRTNSIKRTK